jgi:hypothetical protein
MNIHTPTDTESRLLLALMQKKVGKWRGAILERTIFLERTIDFYIAYKFCDSEEAASEMVEMIFATHKMGFKAKKDLLISLIDKYDPDFKISHPTYVNDLDRVVSLRNLFAHQMLDTSFGTQDSGVDVFKDTGKINLLIFQAHKKQTSYSAQDIEIEITFTEKISEIFAKLLDKTIKSLPPKK